MFANKKKREEKLHVYLAGPDVFKPNPIEVGKAKKELVEKESHIAHFPMDPEIKDFKPDPETAYKIAKGNEGLMKKSQVILVNMTPWHGPSMDVGTAFEVGFMSAKAEFATSDVLIIGYYEGAWEQDFVQRVSDMVYKGYTKLHNDGTVTDENGNTLEDFKLTENLMIGGAIHKTQGAIFQSFEEAVAAITPLWENKQNAVQETQLTCC